MSTIFVQVRKKTKDGLVLGLHGPNPFNDDSFLHIYTEIHPGDSIFGKPYEELLNKRGLTIEVDENGDIRNTDDDPKKQRGGVDR